RTSVELVGVVHADDPLARALFLEQLHRFDAVARGGLGLQARERDRFARLFAPTVGALGHACERGLDLAQARAIVIRKRQLVASLDLLGRELLLIARLEQRLHRLERSFPGETLPLGFELTAEGLELVLAEMRGGHVRRLTQTDGP